MLTFDNSYARLPERFHARLDPTPVAAPRLVRLNVSLAISLGLDPNALAGPEGVDILAGNRVPAGADPIALAYAGHQFGHFVPRLGDGRAILLGEIAGKDIQLKGAGRTPFSRAGDGRAALGPVLREYIVSEAMAALGVPTTRVLAAVMTGETIRRETMLPGAVLTRVAASHIRIGTFQYFAAAGDIDGVRLLADYAIGRHYPGAAGAANPYRAFLDGVIAAQATLVAHWLLIGFIHGVMNTDNTAVSGETIDYGPCAFMDGYDPARVFSSIDHAGRYAYGDQPRIAQWNLSRLAETLLPLLGADEDEALASAREALGRFGVVFEGAYLAGLRRKIGLLGESEEDSGLALDLLRRMAENRADFSLVFRRLCDAAMGPAGDSAVGMLFADERAYGDWAQGWRQRLRDDHRGPVTRAAAMRFVNPVYIPRNHRVEAALVAAVEDEDFRPFEELLEVLSRPYEERAGFERYASAPGPDEQVYQTFCGT